MATHGQCDTCHVRYTWTRGDVPLRDLRCPRCGGPLRTARRGAPDTDSECVRLVRAPRQEATQ